MLRFQNCRRKKRLICELQTAAAESGFNRSKTVWEAGLALELKVNRTSSGVLDSALTVPLNPGTMKIGLKLGQNSDATRTAKFKFAQSLNLAAVSENYCVPRTAVEGNRQLLGGRIGFREWMERLRKTMQETGVEPTQVSYTLQFVIKPNVEFGPKFSLLPIGDVNADVGLNLTALRSTFHTLDIILDPAPKKKITDVRIVADIRNAPPSKRLKARPITPPDASRLNDLLDQQSIKSRLDNLEQ